MANTSANYRINLAANLDVKSLNNQIDALNKSEGKLKELKIKVDINEKALEKVRELNDLLGKTEALNNYTSALKNIQETMKSYENIATNTAKAAQNMANTMQVTGDNAKRAEPKVRSMGQTAVDVFEKFNRWSLIQKVWTGLYNSLTGLIDTVKELDISFTELSKVTDLTADDFDRITTKAYNMGAEVAKTTTEVIDAMTEFAKAGYSVEESTDILAKNALMWTNIADGTIDAAESANMIISVMKAFNIQAEGTTHIIDALNEVSNSYAISSGQLSDSLTKSSSVLAASGTTFEEQLGLITAGTEVLRNANKVSTRIENN